MLCEVSCSYCGVENVDLWPTTNRNYGCDRCLSQFHTCCQCGIVLEKGGGKWFEDGLAYCFYCEREAPQCTWCRRPAFEQATREGERVICVYCADNFPACDRCGELIHGDCLTYQRKVYCRSCGDRYPLCLECGQAIEGEACADCGGPARACGGCGTMFADRWKVYDDTWYCLSCYWRACGACRFCQEVKVCRNNVCDECRATIVNDFKMARDLLAEVDWFCRQELGLAVRQPYQLRLADSSADIPKLHTDAYTLSLSAVGLWAARERVMWVNKGYPGWFTSVILAHEHAHAWQAENAPRQSQDVLEGFASWVEWRVAHHLGYAVFADNMVKLDCPIYGRGLRRCLQLEAQVGAAALVEKMRGLQSFSRWTSFLAWLDEA